MNFSMKKYLENFSIINRMVLFFKMHCNYFIQKIYAIVKK